TIHTKAAKHTSRNNQPNAHPPPPLFLKERPSWFTKFPPRHVARDKLRALVQAAHILRAEV
ncbi:MAG: hypothetical protein OXB89_04745, partial [Anaerolineaceae bacterium]|nr:hypothetical protein [Anaerolineaceae bacterium]